MFTTLFLKECMQMLKCLTYYVVIACIVLFYVSQMGEFKIIEKPQPGGSDYGMIQSNEEAVIMQSSISYLIMEYTQNSYGTYPVGFYKTVKLNQAKQTRMEKIVGELTGLSGEELKSSLDNFLNSGEMYQSNYSIVPAKDLSFVRFTELMKQADHILGGGSKYSQTFLKSNAIVPRTYEQALEEYNNIIEKDRLSGAYARYFCDYMGIVLAILPVFLSVTRGLRDRRAQANEVICASSCSSFYIMISRYLAMLVMILLPIILITVIPMMECIYYGLSQHIDIDQLAYMKYMLGWLMPTVMISLAVGTLLTELTNSAIAIIVQGLWWLISLFMGISNIKGGYSWNLIPRHNTIGNYKVFHDNFQLLMINRLSYSIAAVGLLLASVFIYDMRRRGRLKLGTLSADRKNKSEA